MKKWILRIAKPLFGLSLLALVAYQLDVDELRGLLTRDDPLRLLLSFCSFFAALCVFQAWRLHVLVRKYTGSARASLKLFFIGAFFNNLLPSNVGGDAVRLLYLRNLAAGQWAGPLSMLMLHRVSGLLMILAMFCLYALLSPRRLLTAMASGQLQWAMPNALPPLLWPALLLAGVSGLWLLLKTRIGRRLVERGRAGLRAFWLSLFELPRRVHGSLFVLTVLFHATRMLGFHWAVGAFGETLPLWDLVPVLTFTAAMALLPVTVGGLGVVEGSVTVGLGMFGISPSVAVAAALLHRFALVFVALLGGLVYALDRDRRTLRPPASEQGTAAGGPGQLSTRERIG